MSLSYDLYRPGPDDAGVLALRAEVWGADHPHTSPRFLQWLYQQGPFGPGSGIVLRTEGRAIGFAGLIPRQMMRCGKAVRAAQGLEYMVSPNVRSGLAGRHALKVAKLWEEAAVEQGYSFGFNLPNSNSKRILTSSLIGWQEVLAPALFVRALPGFRATQRVAALPPSAATVMGRTLSAWQAVSRTRVRPPLGVATQLAPGDPRFTELWDAASRSVSVGSCRTSAYLAWRYGQHPLYQYEIHGWEEGESLKAYVVVSPRTLFGIPSLLVTDMLTAPGNERVLTALLDHVARVSSKRDIHILGAQASVSSSAGRILAQAGFSGVPGRINPKPFVVVAHSLADPPGPERQSGNWYFTWGDADVV